MYDLPYTELRHEFGRMSGFLRRREESKRSVLEVVVDDDDDGGVTYCIIFLCFANG
jgi:hypothetical protein